MDVVPGLAIAHSPPASTPLFEENEVEGPSFREQAGTFATSLKTEATFSDFRQIIFSEKLFLCGWAGNEPMLGGLGHH